MEKRKADTVTKEAKHKVAGPTLVDAVMAISSELRRLNDNLERVIDGDPEKVGGSVVKVFQASQY